METLQLDRTTPASRARSVAARYSQLIVIALISGAISGAVWGLTRPAYVGDYTSGGLALDELASPHNVEFVSLAGFSILTAILGAVLAVFAFAKDLRGLGSLLWVILGAAAAAFSVHTFGGWTSSFISNLPTGSAPVEGATYMVVPPLFPGIAWLVGPFFAALMFYVLSVCEQLQSGSDDPLSEIPGTML